MFSISPSSSQPVKNIALFSGNSSSSGNLLTLQLPYQNIKRLPEIPSRKLNQMADYWFRLNAPIALFESLNTNLLVMFDILDKNIDFGKVDDELVPEILAN